MQFTMRIATALTFSFMVLPEISLGAPTTMVSTGHGHANFHKLRAMERRQAVAPDCDTTVGTPGGVSIKIKNTTGAKRIVAVTPGSDVPAAYNGDLSVCPGQDVIFYPGSDFHGTLHDNAGQGAMLEMNIAPDGCAWWDVSFTRGQSNLIAGPTGGTMQGEADYMGKATAAWWNLPFQTRQDYNYNTKYIQADSTGVTKLFMDAGDGTDPNTNVAYQNAIEFMQIHAAFNGYVARGTPWGTAPADKAADMFSQQVQAAVASNAEFSMTLM